MRVISSWAVAIAAAVAACLGGVVSTAGPVGASAGPAAINERPAPMWPTLLGSGLVTCFANLTGDDGDALSSQNFEQGYDIYDAVGADDVTLSAPCTVREVQVVGQYYNNPGPPPVATENVTFYRAPLKLTVMAWIAHTREPGMMSGAPGRNHTQ